MKNKKPKTIKEVVQSYDISEDWEGMYREIKQLIADEVIGEGEKDQEVTVMKMELTETYLEASTAALCYHARKKLREQQRKKLERL